jgi:hypothetical protein
MTILVTTLLWESVKMRPTLPKWGLGSLIGFLKFYSFIVGVKTPSIGTFLISSESYQSVDVENGLTWTIWTFVTQVMVKKGQESNLQFDFRPLKIKNRPNPDACRGNATRLVGKLSMRVTTLLQTSSQLEVLAKSYNPAKWWESKPWQFWDSSLGVPGQKGIRMWVPQGGTENIIWGKVVAFLESGLWWVLWV